MSEPLGEDPFEAPVDLDWARNAFRRLGRHRFLELYTCPGLILTLKTHATKDGEEATADGAPCSSTERFGFVFVRKRANSIHLPLMVTVGRGKGVDIALEFATVSKLHAFFYQVGAGWVVVDSNSGNGTYVAGLKLKPREPHALGACQTIQFGHDVSAKFLLPEGLASAFFE